MRHKANELNLSSLCRWIWEARKNKREHQGDGGYVELDVGSFSALRSVACRVVVRHLTFEFGALPGPHWLAEFADAVSAKAKRRK